MKTIFAVFSAVALIAPCSSAATIGLRWKGQAVSLQKLDVLGSTPGTAQVWMDLLPGESVGTLAFTLGGNSPPLAVIGARGPAGWSFRSTIGALNSTSFEAWTLDPALQLQGPARGFPAGELDIRFAQSSQIAQAIYAHLPDQPWGGVFSATGSRFLWDARYHTTYPGYIAYGNYGNPGWGHTVAKGHQPTANPLLIETYMPEPSTTVLLATAAAACGARRRRVA